MRKFLSILFALMLFASPVMAREKSLTFQWEQEVSTDFAGWNLYMKVDSSGQGDLSQYQLVGTISYDGTVKPFYDSDMSISAPDSEEHEVFFVLTAFDASGNESTASNEVNTRIDFKAPTIPVNVKVRVTGN